LYFICCLTHSLNNNFLNYNIIKLKYLIFVKVCLESFIINCLTITYYIWLLYFVWICYYWIFNFDCKVMLVDLLLSIWFPLFLVRFWLSILFWVFNLDLRQRSQHLIKRGWSSIDVVEVSVFTWEEMLVMH